MRVAKIEEKADAESVRARLLRANLSASQVDKALAALKALNPHVDISNVPAGTVLVVPDLPSFKVSASNSVLGDAFDEFQQTVAAALKQATANLKASDEARAAERADVAAVLGGAPFRRLIEGDTALKQQAAQASEALKQEDKQAAQDANALATLGKAALAELAKLSKQVR